MSINTNKLRSTYIKGQKAYFVSDIEKHFGERPVTKLVKTKSIFNERVKHGNNSQTRRLVFHKDLQNISFEEAGKENTQKVSMFNKIKKYCQGNKESKKCCENEIKGFAPVEISLDKIRKTSISLEKERLNMTKDRIKKLCNDEGIRNVKAKRKAGIKVDTVSRIDFREPYLLMYSAFDRYMRIELKKFNMTLEDIGLGRARNEGKKPYIDRIAEAGQLHNLLVVAEALFQPKTNN